MLTQMSRAGKSGTRDGPQQTISTNQDLRRATISSTGESHVIPTPHAPLHQKGGLRYAASQARATTGAGELSEHESPLATFPQKDVSPRKDSSARKTPGGKESPPAAGRGDATQQGGMPPEALRHYQKFMQQATDPTLTLGQKLGLEPSRYDAKPAARLPYGALATHMVPPARILDAAQLKAQTEGERSLFPARRAHEADI